MTPEQIKALAVKLVAEAPPLPGKAQKLLKKMKQDNVGQVKKEAS